MNGESSEPIDVPSSAEAVDDMTRHFIGNRESPDGDQNAAEMLLLLTQTTNVLDQGMEDTQFVEHEMAVDSVIMDEVIEEGAVEVNVNPNHHSNRPAPGPNAPRGYKPVQASISFKDLSHCKQNIYYFFNCQWKILMISMKQTMISCAISCSIHFTWVSRPTK